MSPSRPVDRAESERITEESLRAWPLPEPDSAGDKESRGTVLVIGGSPEMPGGALLAAEAALRAGAGRLQVATCASVAPLVAAQLPEARVFALPETRAGGIAPGAAVRLAEHAAAATAVLVGPGMLDEPAASRLVQELARLVTSIPLVLDAAGRFSAVVALKGATTWIADARGARSATRRATRAWGPAGPATR